jgi:alpha-D-xyloside xylohydrolase
MQENRDVPQAIQVLPGVWKVTLGSPEQHTPTTVLEHQPATESIGKLPKVDTCPISLDCIQGQNTPRGYLLSMPLQKDEQVYGLGLQLMSFNQRGKKKMLRMNSDPVADTGDSHAPVPFYVTTEGYGVLFDTLRYMTIYCGGANRADNVVTTDTGSQSVVSGSQELYQSRTREGSAEIIAEIPRAQGIDIYIFAGPHMREAVQRYNLFSGGG